MFNVRNEDRPFPTYLCVCVLPFFSSGKKVTVRNLRSARLTVLFFHRFFQRERNNDGDDDDDDSNSDDEDLRIIGMEGFIPLRTLQPGNRSMNDPCVLKTCAAKDRFFSLNNCEQITSRGDFPKVLTCTSSVNIESEDNSDMPLCRFFELYTSVDRQSVRRRREDSGPREYVVLIDLNKKMFF